MDILELAGFDKWMARKLSIWLEQRRYCSYVQRRRFEMICKDEVGELIDPDSADPIARIYYPRVCGTLLSKMRCGVELDSEKLDEIPESVMPYLTRILQGAKFLKNYMDISVLTQEYMDVLLVFLGLDKNASNYCDASVERYWFSEEAEKLIASGMTKEPECEDDDESDWE